MPDLSGIRAIYFDLDDTLCGYWNASKAGLRATFEQHRFHDQSVEDMLDHWAVEFREFCPSLRKLGWYDQYLKEAESTRTELMRRTLLRIGSTDERKALELSQTYMTERDSRLTLFPDAEALLSHLSGRYKLGLITNGPADLQRMEIETLKLGHLFQNILIEGELGFGKPVPEVFQIAQKAFALGPESMLFVGNSYTHDIRPAIEAGWKTAWIRRPSDVPPSSKGVATKPEELPEGAPEPDYTITDLTALIPEIPEIA